METGTQTASTPTRLFLDVDGVLAPSGEPDRPHAASWHDLPPGSTWVYDDTVDQLRRLAADTDVSPWWLTTWNDDVHDLADALNLPEWPVWDRRHAPAAYQFPQVDWWKERVVRKVLASTTARVVWVDDQINWRADPDWLHREFPDRLMLVVPDEHEGLTCADLDLVEAWARK